MSKLLIFGDSILKGVTFSDALGKYRLCKPDYSRLEEEGLEVTNLSKMGATIDYCDKILKEELSEYDDDSIVLFEYGGNDCDHPWREISEAPEGEHYAVNPHSTFESKYKSCIEYAKSMGAKVLISNLVPLDSSRYMEWISKGLKKEEILKWLGDEAMLYRWHESYSNLIERLARGLGATLVDLRGAFLTKHSFAELISRDGIHPTEDGHKLICDTVTEAVLAAV